MKYYEITKNFRGGSKVYHIKLSDKEEVTASMLESIGDRTDGGHAYGYSMKAKKLKKLPKGAKVLVRKYTKTVKVY